MICVVCQEPERPVEPGWLVDYSCWSRMARALREIPRLCADLASLGLVQRDHRRELRDLDTGKRWPHYDPVANALTAGPVNGAARAPRVSGARDAPVPIRIDPTDLLAPARPGSTSVHATGRWPQDQIGWLSVATELDFWATDWATARNEGRPDPQVPILCDWLGDRLDWACREHPALDEFASKLSELYGALMSATGSWPAQPDILPTPCRACGMRALYRWVGPRDADDRVACGSCPSLLTEGDYAEWVTELTERERARQAQPEEAA